MGRLGNRLWVLVPASLAVQVVAYAAPGPWAYETGQWVEVTTRVELSMPAVTSRPAFTLVVDHDREYAGPQRADYFIITIPETGGAKRSPLKWYLTSRDSSIRVALADLTGDGREELVTICRVARASEPRDELLAVWTWNERSFERVLDVLIVGKRPSPWGYEPKFRDATGDGILDLELIRTDGGTHKPSDYPDSIPSGAATAVYSYNPAEKHMNLVTP